MVKKFKMLSFGQICGVQSFRVAANAKTGAAKFRLLTVNSRFNGVIF
jgi:hypothetical protein